MRYAVSSAFKNVQMAWVAGAGWTPAEAGRGAPIGKSASGRPALSRAAGFASEAPPFRGPQAAQASFSCLTSSWILLARCTASCMRSFRKASAQQNLSCLPLPQAHGWFHPLGSSGSSGSGCTRTGWSPKPPGLAGPSSESGSPPVPTSRVACSDFYGWFSGRVGKVEKRSSFPKSMPFCSTRAIGRKGLRCDRR